MSRQLSLFKYINKSSTSSSAKHTNEESGNDNSNKRRSCEGETEIDDKNG